MTKLLSAFETGGVPSHSLTEMSGENPVYTEVLYNTILFSINYIAELFVVFMKYYRAYQA